MPKIVLISKLMLVVYNN